MSESDTVISDKLEQILKRLPKSEREVITKIVTDEIEKGKNVQISSDSKSDSTKVATARDRMTGSGHRVGKGFPAQAKETQRIANLVSAIHKNQFLTKAEKMQAIGMIRPDQSRRFMNDLYLKTIAEGEVRLAENILQLISPERLERMRKEKLI